MARISLSPLLSRSLLAALVVMAAMVASLALAEQSHASAFDISIASPVEGSTLTNSYVNLSFTTNGGVPVFGDVRCLIDGTSNANGLLGCVPGLPNFIDLPNGPHRLDLYAWLGQDDIVHKTVNFIVNDTTPVSYTHLTLPTNREV